MNFHFLLSLVHNDKKNYLNNDKTLAVQLACNTVALCWWWWAWHPEPTFQYNKSETEISAKETKQPSSLPTDDASQGVWVIEGEQPEHSTIIIVHIHRARIKYCVLILLGNLPNRGGGYQSSTPRALPRLKPHKTIMHTCMQALMECLFLLTLYTIQSPS